MPSPYAPTEPAVTPLHPGTVADHESRLRVLEAHTARAVGMLKAALGILGMIFTAVLVIGGWMVSAHQEALGEIDAATTAIAAAAAAKTVRERSVDEHLRDHAQRIRALESIERFGP